MPAISALGLIHGAMDTPELRPELYLQLLKQLTGCESADAKTRYWELLAMLLQTAPPGAGCEDFVHAFCLKHAADSFKQLCAPTRAPTEPTRAPALCCPARPHRPAHHTHHPPPTAHPHRKPTGSSTSSTACATTRDCSPPCPSRGSCRA